MYKFLCPVQRVDDEKRIALRRMGGRLLLGHKHHVGKRAAQTVRNDRISGFISGGDGTIVRL